MILVDKLTNATVSNGILRISCATVAADGAEKASGEILIPVTRIGAVMGDLNNVVKRLREEAQAEMDRRRAAEGGDGAASAEAENGAG
ncbi:MAG: hypothetical protein AAF565_14470 [Pseudomonadota bacterium]